MHDLCALRFGHCDAVKVVNWRIEVEGRRDINLIVGTGFKVSDRAVHPKF